MRVIVLGAGVIGVTSAWYLARAGHEVTVLDRQDSPARETSYANGGQVSVGQAEPWANPAAPIKILKWIGREDAPLLFRLRADQRQWSWALRFLFECLPSRTEGNTLKCLQLANYSRDQLKLLRRETGLTYDDVQKGILTLHTDQREFEMARARISLFKRYGVEICVKTLSQVLEMEPALVDSKVDIVGATHAVDDESGDAHYFTQKLSKLAEKQGVKFSFDVNVVRLNCEGDKISDVSIEAGERTDKLSADAFVVALGSYSPLLLSEIGVHIPVYPVKGYSVTVPIENPLKTPTVCITDENAKVAVTRLGNRLRAAGTAELTGYDLSVRSDRCDAIISRVKQFFPNAGGYSAATRWAGLRPATPSNIPIIGRTKYKNLYLNTGQGTLGWTLACGSAVGLANVIDGKSQDIDFPFIE